MYSETLGWSQGQPVPAGIPAITILQNAIPLGNNDAGPIELPLPGGSAPCTMLAPRGGTLNRPTRRGLDKLPGFHAVVIMADNDQSGPGDFDPNLMNWVYKRSDFIVVWGAGAYAASVSAVAGWMKGKRRVALLMTEETRQAEWLEAADRAAPPSARIQPLFAGECIPTGELQYCGGWRRKGPLS